ncbi:sensor histidine kinase [Longispora albida]|uniref:sensor histidine kinase n=1 Tax=Longispora albida TaxID=203523 RepID=UPI00035C9AC0|nr:sensor histidine kinase [Longispora albida]
MGRFRGWVPDAVIAAALFALSLVFLSGHVTPRDFVLVGLATLPIAVRRAYPRTVLVLVTAAMIALIFADHAKSVPGVAALLALYTVASRYGRRWALIGMFVALAWPVCAVAFGGVKIIDLFTPDSLAIPGAAAIGFLAQQSRQRQQELNHTIGLLGEARAQLAAEAVTVDRARIARELHDVVAHGISVIAVRAGVARALLPEGPSDIRESLTVIEETSRDSLAQMRHLLRALRSSDGSETTPQPTLADLPSLVSRLGQAGLAVAPRVSGEQERLDTGLELAAYRIVQEALTNVVKHAGTAEAEVSIVYLPDRLDLRIRDYGTGPNGHGSGPGTGHGLTGMRERAALLGGSMRAGPAPGGGYLVVASLPYPEPR